MTGITFEEALMLLKALYEKGLSLAKTPEDCDMLEKNLNRDIAMLNKTYLMPRKADE
jgi:hypothetical protein